MRGALAAAILALSALSLAPLSIPAFAQTDAPRAERIAVRDDARRIDADVGILAFTRKPVSGPRPVAFVIGGGPGTSSTYLNLGALGPRRIAFDGGASAPRPVVANDESWLAFTDLVFVDPPG